MTPRKGMIVLMGSGELTATMVEVHKEILSRLGASPKAVFLDTPAGFQLNADQLSQRAVEYFRNNVGYAMDIASFKSKDIPALEAEQALRTLKAADFVLVGPGSPTYAVRQWRGSPVPDILMRRIENGSCLVAASAAALTVGRFTLPVYEIYKVGEEVHWADGIDILGHFGLRSVVIPHWNNAEGGTHDTRFCFMGESRFARLASLLPDDTGILGLDEHTACLIDLERGDVAIRGIGTVAVRHGSSERLLRAGDHVPLEVLLGKEQLFVGPPVRDRDISEQVAPEEKGFWNEVHALENAFHEGIEDDVSRATNSLLELDRLIWQSQQESENPEFISQAREMLREFIVLLGSRYATSPKTRQACLAPLVEELLALRASFRKNKKWKEADEIRDCLKVVSVEVEDTPEGPRWQLGS
ncbi:MAG: Type 1 glutamine amidotransferase-like domain-containing protein [Chloroflexota bacterium]